MAVNIWKFRVKPDCKDEFLRMNSEDWPGLFSRNPGYKGTAVYESIAGTGFCLTEDEWDHKSSFEKCVADYKEDFESLSSKHHALCDEIKHIGWCAD
jgi:hypothetical protein